MRKVKYNYIKESANTLSSAVEWTTDFPYEGVFHQFGFDIWEHEFGTGTYSTAIIERADGTVVSVALEHIKFITPIEWQG